MDFKQLALAARTCRRFEEERPLQMADLEWLVAVSYTHLTLPTN